MLMKCWTLHSQITLSRLLIPGFDKNEGKETKEQEKLTHTQTSALKDPSETIPQQQCA